MDMNFSKEISLRFFSSKRPSGEFRVFSLQSLFQPCPGSSISFWKLDVIITFYSVPVYWIVSQWPEMTNSIFNILLLKQTCCMSMDKSWNKNREMKTVVCGGTIWILRHFLQYCFHNIFKFLSWNGSIHIFVWFFIMDSSHHDSINNEGNNDDCNMYLTLKEFISYTNMLQYNR